LSLSFVPASYGTGALTLDYGYMDDFGMAKTGIVKIAYAGAVHDNVVGTAAPNAVVSPVGNPAVDVPERKRQHRLPVDDSQHDRRRLLDPGDGTRGG
jgi:hypothetical protein